MSRLRRNAALLAALSLSCSSPLAASADPSGPAQPASFHKYVALGDSFAAAPFQDPVDGSSGSCDRSLANYPSQVADGLGLERGDSFVDVTCSGATSYGLTADEGPQVVIGGHSAMIDAIDSDVDLVTVTVGAVNDGLAQTLFLDCNIGGGGCEQKVEAKPQLGDMSGFFPRVEDTVADALRRVRQIAPKATVLVVSYIRVGSAWCPAWGPYNAQDAAYIDGLQARLNDALRAAAAGGGARFVDVNAAPGDHGVCSEEPWVAGGGPLLGGDIAIHPLPEGQAASARAVLAALGR